MMRSVDLRSDTLTRPVPAMRAAMAAAEVGDDVYGEDPTVAELERRVAGLLGHEAGLFMPSGSLANQIGMRLHVAPGEEVIADSLAHVLRAEMGAAAVFSGITSRSWAAPRGLLDPAQPLALMQPDAGAYQVSTRLVVVENTHNFGGGTVQPLPALRELRAATRERGVALHLDGARLWNAHVATGTPLAAYGQEFDTVSVCLSKGLGAPVGSVLVGSAEAMAGARIWRKRYGGGMRQAGILAAGGSGRWSITSAAWPTTTPARGPWRRRWPRSRLTSSTPSGSRPTSSSSTSARWAGALPGSSPRPASGGCGCTPPTQARCGWSGIWTWATPTPSTLRTWSAR